MASTRLTQHIAAPAARVYEALLDADAVATWMVPDDMTSEVHRFEPHVGGGFRISLTYDAPTTAGKTSAQTDTFHGRFLELVPYRKVVETVEFETADPGMRGEMRITFELSESGGETDLVAVHDDLPPALSPGDNELGWRMSLGKLARLAEAM